MKVTLLVGAEGVSETDHIEWIRPATKEEADEFYAAYQTEESREQLERSLTIDMTGRPYYLTTLTEDAPYSVLMANKGYGRVVRLRGDE
jgi:hypothetical protein